MKTNTNSLLLVLAVIALSACSKEQNDGKPGKPTGGSTPGMTSGTDRAIAELTAFIAKHDRAQGGDGKIDKEAANWRFALPKPPRIGFAPGRKYLWKLETTRGPVAITLMPDVAPMHCSSTIYLTTLGFYDGLSFHRVIRGFMAQGGDPKGDGSGDPGYEYDGEYSPAARHDRPYLLSMANGGPGTDGSQFFLTFKPTPHLNDKHTMFGEALDEESRKSIRAMEDLGSAGGPSEAPSQPITIVKASIEVL